jgi:hypothetical protein
MNEHILTEQMILTCPQKSNRTSLQRTQDSFWTIAQVALCNACNRRVSIDETDNYTGGMTSLRNRGARSVFKIVPANNNDMLFLSGTSGEIADGKSHVNGQSRLVFGGIAEYETQLISSCGAAFSVFSSVCASPFCDVFSFYHLACCLLPLVSRFSWVTLEKSVAQSSVSLSCRVLNSDRLLLPF